MSFWTDIVRPLATAAAIVYTGGLAAAAVGGGALGAAITFGARVLAVQAISSLIAKKPDQGADTTNAQLGNRIQAGPSTTNKLSVVYGNAFMPGVLTDVKISTDQKYMWFVYALSEVTDTGDISFDDPSLPGYPLAYWNDKKLEFNATDRTSIDALVDMSTGSPVRNTKVAGKIKCYFYSNGSNNPLYNAPGAISVLSDSVTGGGIASAQQWTSNHRMSNTAFMIIRIQYDQDANLTSVSPVTAYVRNTLNNPGSVAVDYMTNTRYGCGIPSDLIDYNMFTGFNGLNDYCAELIDFNDNAGISSQARYVINGPLDTSKGCLENLNHIMDACDSWLQWDETQGKWSVAINRSFSQDGLTINDLFTVYCDTVYEDTGSHTPATYYGFATSGAAITPNDLNNMYNQVEVQFPSKLIKDNIDYAYINLPANLMNPNEPVNKTIVSLPIVNDSVQAQYIGTRRLEMARDDLILGMDVDFAGIQIEAGDIIRVYHKAYGWDQDFATTPTLTGYGKLFRVTQVQETKRDDGTLGAHLLMSEYNDTIYGDGNITAFLPALNTGLTDPTNISTPTAPTTGSVITTSAIPSFELTMTVPSTGSVTQMEVWYAVAASAPTSTVTFKLWETQYYNNGPVFPNSSTVTTTVTGLPASGSGFNYYFRVRAAGTRSKSDFSPNSSAFSWSPNPTATVTGQNFQTAYEPTPVTVGLYANGEPDLANVVVRLYGLSGPGQVDYTAAASNSAMTNNSWRIDISNIVYSGVTFASGPTDAGTFAQWPAPSSLTANVATITTPVIYKDNTGNVYTAPPTIVNLNKTVPGQTGSRGVVTLAYVPVSYDPTYGVATDTQLTTSFASTTGFNPPIDNDGAVFYNETTDKQSARVYDTTSTPYKWKSATLQVPGQVISNNSVVGTQIKSNTISGYNIAPNTITGNRIAANTVAGYNISADTIEARHLTVGSVTADKIQANVITTDKLVANVITTDKLAANSVTAGKIAANAVDANALAAFSITAGKIDAGAVTATSIAANTITFDKLVIGAVTQSKSTISNPIVEPISFYNWTDGSATWPDDTRSIQPPNGVTIIPTTDPRSSANTEYVEGSRIEVSFSAKLYTSSSPEYNIVELWKSGAQSVYDRGFNSIRHSYDDTNAYNDPNSYPQIITAYGSGGAVYYSQDGGTSFTEINGSTTKTLSGAILQHKSAAGSYTHYYETSGVGKLQNSDFAGYLADYSQNSSSTLASALDLVYGELIIVNTRYTKQDLYDIAIFPSTGLNGSRGRTPNGFVKYSYRCIVGGQGSIYVSFSDSNSWYNESVNTLNDLYSVYANDIDSNNSYAYTAMAVGAVGTIVKSSRTWTNSTFTWHTKPTTLLNGSPLVSDLYAVAGDNSINSSTSTWVAVGEYGVIQVSTDNGENWTQVLSPTPSNLNAVRYCNGVWVIVGDSYLDTTVTPNVTKCTILTSSTPTQSWTQIQADLTDRNLDTIDYSPAWNTINIGGQGCIFNTSAGFINFVSKISEAPTENRNLTRLNYWGSWPLVSNKSLPPAEQRINNGQIISYTVVDTEYVAGQKTTYYLVLGNMLGATVYAGSVYLQATEVKR